MGRQHIVHQPDLIGQDTRLGAGWGERCSVSRVFVLVFLVAAAGLLVTCSGFVKACRAGPAKNGGGTTQASTLLSPRRAEENPVVGA
jgi:hypothetical protein